MIRGLWVLAFLPFLLGVNERRYEPMWGLMPKDVFSLAAPEGASHYPQCFAFRAWLTNERPVTLSVLHLMHVGELVKRGKDGAWTSLDVSDIRTGQLVAVCLCHEVFVLLSDTLGKSLDDPCYLPIS